MPKAKASAQPTGDKAKSKGKSPAKAEAKIMPKGKAKARTMPKGKANVAMPEGKAMPKAKARPTGSSAHLSAREQVRQAVLKKVPRTLKLRFRNGCQKCRQRALCTPSCWAERGYFP